MTAKVSPFWLLEETSGHLRRESRLESKLPLPDEFDLRLYQIKNKKISRTFTASYPISGSSESAQNRIAQVSKLIQSAGLRKGTIVSSHRLTNPRALAAAFSAAGLDFVVEVSPRAPLTLPRKDRSGTYSSPQDALRDAKWQLVKIADESTADYYLADLGKAELVGMPGLRCFAVSKGRIDSFQRGTVIGLSCLEQPLEELAHLLYWVRWIRVEARKQARNLAGEPSVGVSVSNPALSPALNLPVRANQRIAKRLDEVAATEREADLFSNPFRGKLISENRPLNVVELFAGAGGMGLGFLLAHGSGETRFRIIHSAELQPVYANTLRYNHEYLRKNRLVAEDAVPAEVEARDLRHAKDVIKSDVDNAGGVDILIGGPPCQGFSSANRNSWSSSNPNNQLVDTYLDYVDLLKPRVLLMENVQGILWTRRHGSDHSALSVAEHVVERLSRSGYIFVPKLLDAAWYGVPQHRNRFFLLGLHEDLGYSKEDFGRWGPFPRPTHGPGATSDYVTVRDAMADLPEVPNGHSLGEMPYAAQIASAGEFVAQMRAGATTGIVTDHVVSRQADYVIERYRQIPEGGNWENIIEMMTNYASVDRTHSNIYRRLKWQEPSITIGHYRKSMIVHPKQDRGLSLREAARLQSFPDWFRFAGSSKSLDGGLTHKQQQLANAVCPLVTRAVAHYLLKL
jgi:DNA-cytosine methyltransferase